MIAYFDTNVFDHLEQRLAVTETDLSRIGKAVQQNGLRVILSFLNLEEILFIAKSKPDRAKAQVQLIFELADKQLFIRGQDEIVYSDIWAYANAAPCESPFGSMSRDMELDILNLMDVPEELEADYEGILRDTRRSKQTFLKSLLDGQQELVPMARDIGGKRYPFPHYLADNSMWLAEALAERAGALTQVRQRGLEGLLRINSVAVTVRASLSLLYSHTFEGRAPSPGDSRDMLHSLLASKADVFVTNDRPLERILGRLDIAGFQVMSLQNFLQGLPG